MKKLLTILALSACVSLQAADTIAVINGDSDPPPGYSGEWKVATKSGQVIEIKNYLNGKLNGPYIKWYLDGKIHWVFNFQDGEPAGYQVTFTPPDGKPEVILAAKASQQEQKAEK